MLNTWTDPVLISHYTEDRTPFLDQPSMAARVEDRQEGRACWQKVHIQHVLVELQSFSTLAMEAISRYHRIPGDHILVIHSVKDAPSFSNASTLCIHVNKRSHDIDIELKVLLGDDLVNPLSQGQRSKLCTGR
uniref:Uncharacterized protein n=1 Tax=Arundo donax TaxID=35708 RepID=A0A0A9GV74_ARUDO